MHELHEEPRTRVACKAMGVVGENLFIRPTHSGKIE